MQLRFAWLCLGLLIPFSSVADTAADAADDDGFESIFDGKSLDGWDGNPKFWKVEDGTITGQTTADNPTSGNTFLVWRKGETANFELKCEYRIVGGNSGIQYRSFEVPNEKWVIGGYQADIDSGDTYSGICYGERFRGILANRGEKTIVGDDSKPKVVGTVGDSKTLQSKIKKEDWNNYHIVVNGFQFRHMINGNVTCELTDEDQKQRRDKGVLALQLHAGPPMKVQFRNIRLKRLPAAAAPSGSSSGKKKVVLVSGKPSHGYGAHEHYAGCMILADALNKSNCNIEALVVKHGWPEDKKVFDGADCVVMYSDGGAGHMVVPHLAEVDALAQKGVGIVCIHYAVEMTKGEAGDRFLDWIGGYFEMNWSVNPHWTAKFNKFPDHPIARGVKPFSINDEWYYHMRFRPKMEGVTPILTDLPPDETLQRGDGPHSGNPHVRAAIARKEPQHVAWAAERKNGGRGFGFTGGHDHWNWGEPNFRKLMLNAIAWCAKHEVPADGVEAATVSLEDLEKNQDYPPPEKFDRESVRKRLRLPASDKTSAVSRGAGRKDASPKPVFQTEMVTSATAGHAVNVDVDIRGARELYLVVTDGGNDFSCDWADWAEPRLVTAQGVKKLTEIRWKAATTDWGQVRVDKNAGGGPLKIAGSPVEYGIGTHANSLIAFDLPPDVLRFQARAGLDNGGTDQGDGGASSVQFLVFTTRPDALVTQSGKANSASRDAAEAVAGLDVADGLEATLFSSEPEIRNVTNLDIDHRGRVWVCEVMNYRAHKGKRPEGDRILILEDSDHDGKADKQTVFYQGTDVDSAMGICVLGRKIIVSASPNILVFTDEDGDDRPDKKEILFSNTGQPQHDHSAHSFLFGPDGKLYWNFGNTGQKVCDRDGKPIVDRAGNTVVDNGKPYFGGMPFRCDLDGSHFEVLAHNFRNNYEIAVDSYGGLWQSDNDDDGNRGVRINFVMEYGNYGYRDEITGAGWNTPRTNLEQEIPYRHWHLNDPGVVPNLLQTGAGSPTGITVYEGRLLPKAFWNQVIHCDAGPNVVRAYPAQVRGAGYSAEVVDLVKGARDNWFRPADVCVAPDGSVFVTDWYDPGVGGHAAGDLERGRVFRIAPPGSRYVAPSFDFQSDTGAAKALESPNLAVRYLAWSALHAMGERAEPVLARIWKSELEPRLRARALWLLGKIPGRGPEYVRQAIGDANPDLRCVGLRLARQLDLEIPALVEALVRDPSAAVRRECAIALRFQSHPKAASLWAQLAEQHDGRDRWYLEALGIGADRQWDACLQAWLERVRDWNTPAGRDIVWRSRAVATPAMLAEIIRSSAVSAGEIPRYLRAFDFQNSPSRNDILSELAFGPFRGDAELRATVVLEAARRIPAFDIESDPNKLPALEQVLTAVQGSAAFVELIAKFNVTRRFPELLQMAQKHTDEQIGVEAMRALMGRNQLELISRGLSQEDPRIATSTARVLGTAADGRIVPLLLPIVVNAQRDLELRRQATRSIATTRNGAQELLNLAKAGQLDERLTSAAAFLLHAAPWGEIKAEAVRLFPVPAAKDRPLPAIDELIKAKGDAQRGGQLFAKTAECSKCHVVDQQGKDVGPNLSEIGSKLSRQALFESILYPSAGISHSFETYAIESKDGNVAMGLLVSQTDAEVTIKLADALQRTYKKSDVETIKKLETSLMPADLQKTMTAQDLLDVVEYLATLRKK
ncbi:MAG: DUF1080 domain-containing protein [Planctomycetes bacterium]|nr:DUF1080 domain-containing protein [Planctomycetota bacterium]